MAAVIRNRVRAHSSSATGRLVAAVALLFSVLVACSTGDGGNAAPTTTTRDESEATSTTTASAGTVEDEIVARYRAFWEARFEAGQEPVNPDHPGLREYASGAQLENVIEETRERQEKGLAFRWPENSVSERGVRVLERDSEEAKLYDCAINDGVVYRIDTGEVIDDSVVTRSVEATMRLVDGEWKLAEALVVQEWEGVAGCALADDG